MERIDYEPTEPTYPVVSRVVPTEKTALFNLFGKAHAMAILHEFALEPRPWRFNELKERLNVSPNTLSERLNEFVEADLVTRRSYDEVPPHVEYEPTAKARELEPMYRYLCEWADRHDP